MKAEIFTAGELSKAADYDVLLLGSSTWGWRELQDDLTEARVDLWVEKIKTEI